MIKYISTKNPAAIIGHIMMMTLAHRVKLMVCG